ncbi:MAG: hypothetical protein Tsb0021_06670 [Chlamydiales bacterium]
MNDISSYYSGYAKIASNNQKRLCHLVGVFATPACQIISVVCVAKRALKLLSFYHFWRPGGHDLSARFSDAGKDAFKIIAHPFAIIGLEFANIYGLFNPDRGFEVYRAIEIFIYGQPMFGDFFDPDVSQDMLD